MAALTADVANWRIVPTSGILILEVGVNGAATFFRGGLACITPGTGKPQIANADADEFFGVTEKKLVATAANQLTTFVTRGVVWFTGAANLTIANVGKLFAATAASDNPADLLVQAAGNPGAAGRLLAVDVTAVSGYIDLSDRSAVVNA